MSLQSMQGFLICNNMKKVTLENFRILEKEYSVIIFQDRKSELEIKPLMLMVSYIPQSTSQYEGFGFMNISDPLHTDRIYSSHSKSASILGALLDNQEVYATTAISRICFAGPGLNMPEDNVMTVHNPRLISEMEDYVCGLLRRHTTHLIEQLCLNQYPREVLYKETEEFIKSL